MLNVGQSGVLVVDVQEAFRHHVAGFDELVAQVALLLGAANRLGIAVAASEQYPAGLGSTVPELAPLLGDAPILEKLDFDASSAAPDRESIVLVGIEAHVCVRHTALALLESGREVHVVVDGVGSRTARHRDIAVAGLVRAGAHETTVEQVLFDWLARAGTPEFRDVQALVKAAAAAAAT